MVLFYGFDWITSWIWFRGWGFSGGFIPTPLCSGGGGGSVGEFNFENAEVRILGVSKGGEKKVAFAWTGAGRLVGDGHSDWVLQGVVA